MNETTGMVIVGCATFFTIGAMVIAYLYFEYKKSKK